MATLTLLQPANMATLQTNAAALPVGVSVFTTEIDFSYQGLSSTVYLNGSGFFSIPASFVFLGLITDCTIDTQDLGLFPNILVTGLQLSYTSQIFNLLNSGNVLGFANVVLSGNDTLVGSAGADVLLGFNGSDVLDGKGGLDTLDGGANNDTYVLGNSTDTVNDASGVDTITSTITRTLAAFAAIENLTLTGAAAANGTGNGGANILTGNNAINTLDGGLGNDTINGLGGNDILIGWAGKDTSTGGPGNDIFRFRTASHSPVGANADVVKDFDDYGDDRIDLSQVFAATLSYRHNAAFTAAGQVRINDIAGADVIVEVNTGGSLAADMQIRLTGTTLASMATTDFLL